MKTISFAHRALELEYPATSAPAWAAEVERWYQLDTCAYVLTAAYSAWKGELSPPARIYLASTGASNRTDRAFAATGATSPTRFVHTLPNIRASSLLQVMDWNGPVFSLHRDPFTLGLALGEALHFTAENSAAPAWVFYPELVPDSLETPVKTTIRVHLWIAGNLGSLGATHLAASAVNDKKFSNDHDIFAWLRGARGEALPLGQGWLLQKLD